MLHLRQSKVNEDMRVRVAQMSTAVAVKHTLSIGDRYLAAIKRASDEGLRIVRNADGSASCKTYTLTFVGPRWHDVKCTCDAGQRNVICKHAAAFVYMRKYCCTSVQFKGKGVVAHAIAPSTAAEIIDHALLMVQAHTEGGTTMSRDEFGVIMRALNSAACTPEQLHTFSIAANHYAERTHTYESAGTRLVDTRPIAL